MPQNSCAHVTYIDRQTDSELLTLVQLVSIHFVRNISFSLSEEGHHHWTTVDGGELFSVQHAPQHGSGHGTGMNLSDTAALLGFLKTSV